MMKSRWKVVCQVCARVLLNTEAKLRWDGLVVCPNDWERKHEALATGLHKRFHRSAEGSLPKDAVHTGEPADTFLFVCDMMGAMGLSGYGTTECARASTYNIALALGNDIKIIV
jgi:hypothetical protein